MIGTLALREAARGHDVLIVTGDKDFMQLVGDAREALQRLRPSAGEIDLVERGRGVKAKFGVAARRA